MRRSLLLLSLLVVPSFLSAQRTQATRRTDLGDTPMPQGPTLRVRDVEDQSPLKMFADKHKDLKLTDAQTEQLKAADKVLHDKNAASFHAIDSLVGVLRSAARSDMDADRTRGRIARASIMGEIDAVNANNDAAAKEQMATFDAAQQAKAAELLAKQQEEGKKMLRTRLGGGRGGNQ